MSEEESGRSPSLVAAWYEFAQLRRDLAKIRGFEVTSFGLQYGVKNEQEFRQTLREDRILLEKIEKLVGPETQLQAQVI